MRIVHSAVGRPQGRGKVERFFGTIDTELLPDLPGRLTGARATAKPSLTLPELDRVVGAWITRTCHERAHSQTGVAPIAAWCAGEWLPRIQGSLEDFDLLLVMVAKPRMVQRGRHPLPRAAVRKHDARLASTASGRRYATTLAISPNCARSTGNRFLCRAVCPDVAAETITLAGIQAARGAHRRDLRPRDRGSQEEARRSAERTPRGVRSGAPVHAASPQAAPPLL